MALLSPGWQTADGSSSLSYSAPSGTDRVLVVAVWGRRSGSNAPITATGITWGGVALALGEDSFFQGGGSRLACEIWYLLESNFPAGATGTISVAWSATPDVDQGINAATYDNVGSFNSADDYVPAGTSSSASVTLNHNATGSTLIGWAIAASGSITDTLWTNATDRLDFDTASATKLQVSAADSFPSSGSSTTITAEANAGISAWAMVGLSLNEPTPAAKVQYNLGKHKLQALPITIGAGVGV